MASPNALKHGTARYHTWLQNMISRMLVLVVEPLPSLWLGPLLFLKEFELIVGCSKCTHTWYCIKPYLASSPNLQFFRTSATELPFQFFFFSVFMKFSPLHSYDFFIQTCTVPYMGSTPNLQKFIPSAYKLQFQFFIFVQYSWISLLYTYMDFHPIIVLWRTSLDGKAHEYWTIELK